MTFRATVPNAAAFFPSSPCEYALSAHSHSPRNNHMNLEWLNDAGCKCTRNPLQFTGQRRFTCST